MLEKSEKNEERPNRDKLLEKDDFEAKQNLLGFFDLLLKIDMRHNLEKYKKPKEKND